MIAAKTHAEHSPDAPLPAAARGPWKKPPPPDPLKAVKDAVINYLTSQAKTVFALLDSARNEEVLRLLTAHGIPASLPDEPSIEIPSDHPDRCEFQSLYIGQMAAEMAEQGPFLVRLPKRCSLVEAVVRAGWGDSWGVFLTSSSTFAAVRQHFRRFIMVRHPDGDAMFFRFYDPRTARAFLPACSRKELQQFFGPIRSLLIEGIQGRHGNEVLLTSQGLSENRIAAKQ